MSVETEKWKQKKHVVQPTKNPALMSQREALEWEMACLKKRLEDMPAQYKPKYSEGYEIRIKIIESLLKKSDTVLNAVHDSVKTEEEEISTIVPLVPIKEVEKPKGDSDLNPLLESELKKEKREKPPKIPKNIIQ